MRILMIIDLYTPLWGGAQAQMRQLIPLLRQQGYSFTILTRRWHKDWERELTVDDTRVHRIGSHGFHAWGTMCYLLGLVGYVLRHRKDFDIIHTQGAALLGGFGRLLAVISGKKCVARIATAGRIPKLMKSLPGKMILSFFRKADRIICLSDEIRGELKAIGVADTRIATINNAVDTERFRPLPPEQRQQWLAKHNLPIDSLLLIFSGRIVKRKGLDRLIQIWPTLQAQYPNLQLIVIGSGRDNPDSNEDQVRNQIQTQQLTHIHFLGDVDHTEEILGVADVFVLPSSKEGMSNALLEAMAAQLVVVASQIGGNCELIEDQRTGYLFELDQDNGLETKLLYVLSHLEEARSCAARARENALADHGFTERARDYHQLYQALAKEN